MLKHAVAVVASAWLVGAQNSNTTESSAYHPHAAFAFIRTGERTPLERPGVPVLSAVGANQLYTLGQNFRTRYVAGTSPSGLGVQHIAGLAPSILNNEQIWVQTTDAQYLVSAAQAFMQGLYPPHGTSNGTGPATGILSDGTVIDYPLNGYQYANIHSTGEFDAESIYVAGADNCPAAQRDAMKYFMTDEFIKTKAANEKLYDSLNVDWFEGNMKKSDLDYISALEIADYLRYQYAHNASIYTALSSDSTYAGVFDKIKHLADEEAWYLYGNTSTSSRDADNQAMAGKTLAASIVKQFELLIVDRLSGGDTTDMSYPLTFYFGEQEAMMSLLSIMMADFHNEYFHSIPTWGSAMVFELYSTGKNVDFPTNTKDLWVRFYFHNGTDFEGQFMTYPILGNGPSGTEIPWLEFEDMFMRLGVDRKQWCSACDSPALFCIGENKRNTTLTVPLSSSTRTSALSPTVAGVIGALVALIVAALLFALAMLLAGIRLHRVQRTPQSELGGFKGSAKLASDPDLSLAKNGAPPAGIVTSGFADQKRGHERVGSWELRQKEFGKGPDFGEERRESFDAIDAVAAGQRPVEPRDSV